MPTYKRRVYPKRAARTTLRGKGAYRATTYKRPAIRRRTRAYGGKGAYYVRGGVNASARLPFGSFSGNLSGGYANDAKYLSGLGAYNMSNIKHNVLIKPDIPQIRNSIYVEGGTIVRHREYLGPVITSSVAGAFDITSYPLNPAQSRTFPWLSQISSNFEEYKPNGLMFEFRSTASDAIASSTNLALGQVMMCTQYDPTDPEFTSDVELLNYSWAQSGKVSDNVQHFVECDPKQSPLSHLYTRPGTEASPSDLRFSDFGRFSIATSGLQGTSVQIGQLWVTYEFIHYKCKIGESQSTAGGQLWYDNSSGTVSQAVPLGTIASGKLNSNLDVTLSSDVANFGVIQFPPLATDTSYMMQYTCFHDSAINQSPPTFSSSSASVKRLLMYHDGQLHFNPSPSPGGIGTTSSKKIWTSYVTVLAGDVATDYRFALPQAVTNAEVTVMIAEVPYLDPAVVGSQN